MVKKTSYIIIALLLAGAVSWYMFGRVSDDRSRIDEIRADIQSATDQQQSAIDRLGTIGNGLSDSAAEAGRVSGEIGGTVKEIITVEDRISASQERVRDSAELIREGESILSGIRARGQAGD